MNQDHQSAPSGHRGEQMQQDSVHSALTTSGVPSAVHRAEGGENAPLAEGSALPTPERVAEHRALLARNAAIIELLDGRSDDRADAARYRWLRAEHERADPICHLVWKAGGNREGAEWVNTARLDAAIDAAMQAHKARCALCNDTGVAFLDDPWGGVTGTCPDCHGETAPGK